MEIGITQVMASYTTEPEMKDQARNLNPTAPAVIAMTLFGLRYAGQRGGSMDFWDSLSDGERRLCAELAERVRKAPMPKTEVTADQ